MYVTSNLHFDGIYIPKQISSLFQKTAGFCLLMPTYLRCQHSQQPHEIIDPIVTDIIIITAIFSIAVVPSEPADGSAVVGVGIQQGSGVRGGGELDGVRVFARDGEIVDEPGHRVRALDAAAVKKTPRICKAGTSKIQQL